VVFESIGRHKPRKLRRSFGSTDLASVSQAVPTIEIFVKAADVPIHTEDFAREAAAAGGDRALLDGVYLLASAGCRILSEPDLLAQIREAFTAPKSDEATWTAG